MDLKNSKMQGIADKAGIKRTVLNYYCSSKDLLYQKKTKTIIRIALLNMLKVLIGDLPFEQKIEAVVENCMNWELKIHLFQS